MSKKFWETFMKRENPVEFDIVGLSTDDTAFNEKVVLIQKDKEDVYCQCHDYSEFPTEQDLVARLTDYGWVHQPGLFQRLLRKAADAGGNS